MDDPPPNKTPDHSSCQGMGEAHARDGAKAEQNTLDVPTS